MNKHKDMVRNVTFVEKFQYEMVTEKTFTKKAQHSFWFQVGDIKISDILYKIQKFIRSSWAPIITTNGINFLMAGPFQIHSCPGAGHKLKRKFLNMLKRF